MASFSTAGIATASARHPWRVIISWIVVLIVAGAVASTLGDALTTSTNFTGKPDSQKGADLLLRLRPRQPLTETVILKSDKLTIDDASFKSAVESMQSDLKGLSNLLTVSPSYYEASSLSPAVAQKLVSADKHETLILVTFNGGLAFAQKHVDDYLGLIAKHNGNGMQALTVGDVSADHEFTKISSEDLSKSEKYSLPVTIVILIVIFGALVAAGIPLILALVSILTALGLTAIVGRFTNLSFYVVNMIIMIGTAVGIDYTLFIVERYREERRHGLAKHEAIAVAGGTASKAVLFSGITVFLALMGMFLVPLTVFRSLGAGAVLAVISAVAAMLTLVPAMLSLIGDRVNWPRRRRYDETTVQSQRLRDAETYHHGFWGKVTKIVTARPAIFVVGATLLLAVCAIPYFDIVRGSAGIETLPPSNLKTAYTILHNDFSVGVLSPVEIVVDGKPSDPAVQASIQKLSAAIAQDQGFGPVAVTTNQTTADNIALLSTPLNADPSSEAAVDAVKRLRNDLVPPAFAGTGVQVYVAGAPGFNADYFKAVDDSTVTVFVFVLGLSFLLLLLAFRSIVVPIKAIIMNLLSVGASYGLLVLVFQKGYGHSWFGFQKSPAIEAWVPTFLFCVLFGLSMDYHVFLLSRIREHYDLTHDNRLSVASGLQATARIITGAALIMVVVFAGFATGQLVAFQQMGFGLAVAVFLDATLVRSVLVPAAMTLLGDANWYLPRWLNWLPDLRIEGAHVNVEQQQPAPAD